MSGEEPTTGGPGAEAGERWQQPATAAAAAAAPDAGRQYRGREGAGTEETTAEEIAEGLLALDFGVHKSIRYHAKRRAFLDTMHRFSMLVAVVGGSAAFFALIGDKTSVGQVAALVVAIATALDAVFAFPESAREHDKLAERFSDLASELAIAEDEASGSRRLAKFKSRRLALEKNEPTPLQALNVICHNEEATARGYGKDQIYRVGWPQRILAQFVTFPWFDPVAQAP